MSISKTMISAMAIFFVFAVIAFAGGINIVMAGIEKERMFIAILVFIVGGIFLGVCLTCLTCAFIFIGQTWDKNWDKK